MSAARTISYKVLAALGRASMASGLSSRALRVLGYHDAPDPAALRRQLHFIRRHFSVTDVAGALDNAESRPLLVTFDDGDPTVVDLGLAVLEEAGVKAVMFVCPGVIGTSEPFWWEIVQRGIDLGVDVGGAPLTPAALTTMKRLRDPERRATTTRIRSRVEEIEERPLQARQLTLEQLQTWVAAGHAIGNHTWDHPTLDTCEPGEQERQIVTAHEWLAAHDLMAELVFAYPNGNETAEARAVLERLGYRAAFLFDHRTGRRDHLAVSRLRVNVDCDMDGFVARVSGLHPMLHSLAGRS